MNFKNRFRKWVIIGIESVIVLISGYLIFNSDAFQELVSPKNFWENKVQELSGNVQQNRWKVRSLEIALDKERASGQYDIQAASDRAKSFSEDVADSEKFAKDAHLNKIDSLRKEIEESKKTLLGAEEKLQFAIKKLANQKD